MERPLWNRIQEIYHLTLPIPRSERSAFLSGACAAALRAAASIADEGRALGIPLLLGAFHLAGRVAIGMIISTL